MERDQAYRRMGLVGKKLGARAGSKGPCKARLIVGISLVIKINRDNRLIDGTSLAGYDDRNNGHGKQGRPQLKVAIGEADL